MAATALLVVGLLGAVDARTLRDVDYHNGGPQITSARSCFFTSLPPGFRGNASLRTTTYWGTLKSARDVFRKAMSSRTSICCPGLGTTTAPTFSPIIGSGTAVTAASNTAGYVASAFSTSTQ